MLFASPACTKGHGRRCMGALSPASQCDCQCGGANHGRGVPLFSWRRLPARDRFRCLGSCGIEGTREQLALPGPDKVDGAWPDCPYCGAAMECVHQAVIPLLYDAATGKYAEVREFVEFPAGRGSDV